MLLFLLNNLVPADYTINTPTVNIFYERQGLEEALVTFNVDGIALEPDESFMIDLEFDDGPEDPSENFFFLKNKTFIIKDNDSKFYCFI